jgi:hypothetical protein
MRLNWIIAWLVVTLAAAGCDATGSRDDASQKGEDRTPRIHGVFIEDGRAVIDVTLDRHTDLVISVGPGQEVAASSKLTGRVRATVTPSATGAEFKLRLARLNITGGGPLVLRRADDIEDRGGVWVFGDITLPGGRTVPVWAGLRPAGS